MIYGYSWQWHYFHVSETAEVQRLLPQCLEPLTARQVLSWYVVANTCLLRSGADRPGCLTPTKELSAASGSVLIR